MLFEYANNASERASELWKERKWVYHRLQKSIRSHAKIRWDYFVSRAKGKSRILNINVYEWIKNYTVFLTWDALLTNTHPTRRNTITERKKSRKENKNICTIETRNTNNELRLFWCFQETDTIFFPPLFVIIPVHFPTAFVLFIAELSTTNDTLFTLTSSNIAILTILTFRFFFYRCHFIRISNLMNITLCHLYCKWIFFRVLVANGTFRSTDLPLRMRAHRR